MSNKSYCLTSPTHSFAGLPVCTQLNDLEVDIAIIGLHYISPYPQRLTATAARTAAAAAPDAIRLQSSIFIGAMAHSGQIGR